MWNKASESNTQEGEIPSAGVEAADLPDNC